MEISSSAKLYNAVDDLPKGMSWHCREIAVKGDLMDESGKQLTETVEVWYRDPIACVRELIGNPMFAKMLAYAPELVFRDAKGTERQIDEMWTADWWWKMQVSSDSIEDTFHSSLVSSLVGSSTASHKEPLFPLSSCHPTRRSCPTSAVINLHGQST